MKKSPPSLILLLLYLLTFETSTQAASYYCSNFCARCSVPKNTCTLCGERFYWDHIFKVCVLGNISGCLVYKSGTICQTCGDGYINQQGTCKKCTIARCADCSTDISKCLKCKPSFTFNTSAKLICNTACNVNNCAECFVGNGAFCATCEDGYRRTTSDQCEKCDQVGCKGCPTNKSVCNGTCLDEFYFFRAKCEPCTSGCKKCAVQGTCTECDVAKGFYMDKLMDCVFIGSTILEIQVVLGLTFLGVIFFA